MVTCVGEYAGMVTVKMTIHGKDFKILNMWTSFNYTDSNIHHYINICQKTCDQNGLQELDVHPRKESCSGPTHCDILQPEATWWQRCVEKALDRKQGLSTSTLASLGTQNN